MSNPYRTHAIALTFAASWLLTTACSSRESDHTSTQSASGGGSASGGVVETFGGSSAASGGTATATGGSDSIGDSAIGGNATGGNATGGNATGGNATGDNTTGSGANANGGNATGGSGGTWPQGGTSSLGGAPQGGTSGDAASGVLELQLGASNAVTRLTQLTVSPAGALFAIGWTDGSVDPNGPYGDLDALLVKIAPDGSLAWVRQFGQVSSAALGIVIKAWDATVTPTGDLIVTGLVNGRGRFRGQTLQTTFSGFVAAFDGESGAERWVRLLSGTDGATEAMGIEMLDDGTIAVAGATSASLFAGQPSLGAMDVFLAWISREGELLRVQRYGGADEEYPTAFGSRGASLYYSRKAVSLSSGATLAVELTRVDATGAVARHTMLEAPAQTEVVGLSATDTGVCAALAFATYTEEAGPGIDYGFTCFSDEWQPLGSVRRGTPGAIAQPLALSCTPAGDCAIAGYATSQFEGNTLQGLTEAFVATFDTNYVLTGTSHFTTRTPDDNANARVNAIARGPNANLVVAGDVRGPLFADPLGNADIFVTTPIPNLSP